MRAPFQTNSWHFSLRVVLVAILFAFLLPPCLRGQVGNDNPTGPAGFYNGDVTTAGTYDPYTGNATRTITDLAVAGAVGKYGLSLSRTADSRGTPGQFGAGGGWYHSFGWSIDPVEDLPSGQPIPYTVNFPDGRVLFFSAAGSQNGTFRATASGVSERLKPWDGTYCYLLLPDGGRVQFLVSSSSYVDGETHQTFYNYYFTTVALIDPYGVRLSFSYDGSGNLSRVTEQGGRYIDFFYLNAGAIDYIRASDGREVHYSYQTRAFPPGTASYTVLTNVSYYGDSSLTATYNYQAPNLGDGNGAPLLSTCYDPMYAGPMKGIAYLYATGTNSDGTAVPYGQIQSENYLDPSSNTIGEMVSSLAVYGDNRTESRGDGPSRSFSYSNGKLVAYSDFKGQMSYISYDGNGYTSAFTDARGNTTTTLREGLIGALSVLTHPDDAHSTQGYTYWNRDGCPYYVQISGDERGHNTYFTRDSNTFQLTRIDYPDYPNGAYETFAYNGLGQVYSHRMTSGGVETSYYDGRGMMYAFNNPDGTTYYYYDGLDRLEHVTDPRSNMTWFRYNSRGQVTRITHMDGSYKQMAYNPDGTLAWSADENHPGAETDPNQRTRYAYDNYKRVVSVTNPLNQTTTYVYAQDWSNAYNQTTTNLKGAFSPMGKAVHYAYDENWQRTIMRVPPTGDPNSDSNDAWTYYGYDPVGNLLAVRDPRGYTTSFAYDNRDRRVSLTDALNETTTWQYDTTSNITRETRPDQSYRQAVYDSMNRVIDAYGFANDHTHYDRDLAGNVWQMIDPKNAYYNFGHDAMNRKTSATYPADVSGASRTENFWYDGVGNLIQYKNPADQYKYFGYDNRNRLTGSSWNWGGPSTSRGYDAVGRLTSIVTNGGETSVAFGYDDANRQLWEDQTVSGYPTRRVRHDRDADGNAVTTEIPSSYLLRYTYNQRNQLAQIQDGGSNPWFIYSYDPAGNMTKRRDGYWGVNDSTNVTYDELGRPLVWADTHVGDNEFAESWHQYDSLSRLTATWRLEQYNKGERFTYDALGQLTNVVYNADQVWTGNPQNADRTVDYDVDPLNRWAVSDSAAPRTNGLSATYYNGIDLSGSAVLQNDSAVNFSWNGASPAPGIGGEWFSARWEGEVMPRYSENYTFYTQSDDGVRLWVNGQLLIDDWNYHGTIENSGTITLTAGKRYSIRMEYFQGCCGAVAALLWSSPSQGKEVIPSSQLFAARPGNGLRGTYYSNIDFTGTKVVQTDATINFDWGSGSPAPAIGADNFSVRWEGQIVPRYSETYTFYAGSDDGVRLWINGQLIVDNWWDRGYTEGTGTITLVAGQAYDLRMDYYEHTGGALATLAWSSASQGKEIVPQSQLFVPAGGGNYRSNGLNQYTNVGGQALSYDQNFNLTGYDGTTFSYNAQNQLMSATKGTNTVQFVYDGLGRCLKRTTNGAPIILVYDGWKSLADFGGDGSWWAYRIYGPGSDEVLWLYDSRIGYTRVHTDRRGNVSFLLDASGNGVERYTYDAFGTPTITDWYGNVRSTSAYGNRFLFQGREWLAELGIYDFRFRHYQPQLGRFLQKDPLRFGGGDANLFRYCGGDPVNRRDPRGMDPPRPTYQSLNGTYTPEELAAMPSTGPIDVHATELPGYDRTAGDGHRDIGALDRVGGAAGEGGSRDTGGGGGEIQQIQYREPQPPRGVRSRSNRSNPPVWKPGNPNVPTQPWEIEPYEPPHDVDQLDGDIAAQSLKDIFNLLFGWLGDLFSGLPPYTPLPEPTPSIPYAPQPSPSGPPTPSPGGGG